MARCNRKTFDLTGRVFGRLRVISKVEKDKKHSYWLCRCTCGNTTISRADGLLSGRIKSCGCYRREILTPAAVEANTVHGMRNTRLYDIWCLMRSRCNNPRNNRFSIYGGRGIKVCKEWDDFRNFAAWALNNGYRDDLTIERIDVNGNYGPSNCKWVPRKQQSRNRRNTVYIIKDGKRQPLVKFLEDIGRKDLYSKVMWRVYEQKLSVDQALVKALQREGLSMGGGCNG